MPQDHHVTPAQPPEDFQEYADSRFGFKVYMPKRFEILPETVDPLARMIRGLNELSEEEAAKLQPRMPIGFWDPDVIGELENGGRSRSACSSTRRSADATSCSAPKRSG